MFDRHGLLALLAGRFLAFVLRCCQPWREFPVCQTAASSFQLVKWIAVGQRGNQFRLCINMIPFVKRHEDQVMTFLMILQLPC